MARDKQLNYLFSKIEQKSTEEFTKNGSGPFVDLCLKELPFSLLYSLLYNNFVNFKMA